jgi:hypothetical protein
VVGNGHDIHARVRSAPTGGHRHQDGPASTGQPIRGVNLRQRSIWMAFRNHQASFCNPWRRERRELQDVSCQRGER